MPSRPPNAAASGTAPAGGGRSDPAGCRLAVSLVIHRADLVGEHEDTEQHLTARYRFTRCHRGCFAASSASGSSAAPTPDSSSPPKQNTPPLRYRYRRPDHHRYFDDLLAGALAAGWSRPGWRSTTSMSPTRRCRSFPPPTTPPRRTPSGTHPSAASAADGGIEVCASAPVRLQPPGLGVTADPRGLTLLFADLTIIELTELTPQCRCDRSSPLGPAAPECAPTSCRSHRCDAHVAPTCGPSGSVCSPRTAACTSTPG